MSSRLIHGTGVWAEITKLCSAKGTRRAAIAFLGADAPRLLPLSRRSDVLLVNASGSALGSGATNPDALAWYVEHGVRVLSSQKLHAKLVVTAQWVVVGSANASAHSTQLDEAAIVSDDDVLRARAIEFIDQLDDTTVVDAAFIDAARTKWRAPKGGPPGAGDQAPDPPFLPVGKFRLEIMASTPYTFTKREQAAIAEAQKGLRRRAGPKATYSLIPFAETDLAETDVMIDVIDGYVVPPRVVIGKVSNASKHRPEIVMLRVRNDLREVPLAEAEERLRACGVRVTSSSFDPRRVTAPKTREALLSIWGLL